MQALGNKNDVLIGISTSGNSKNVIKAIQYSINFGIKTIGLTGGEGGKLSKLADLVIKVPSQNVQHIQEAHITIGHILCDLVEKELYKDQEEE